MTVLAAAEEIDVSQILGMIIALVAVLYTLGTSFYEIFKNKKSRTASSPAIPPEPRVSSHMDNKEKIQKKALERLLQSMKRETEFEDEQDDEEQEEWEEELEVKKKQTITPFTPPPLPHAQNEWRRPEEKFVFHTAIEDFKQKTAIEERKLDVRLRTGDELIRQDLVALAATSVVTTKPKRLRLADLLQRLPSKKAMIIASELVQPPLGFRKMNKFP